MSVKKTTEGRGGREVEEGGFLALTTRHSIAREKERERV
jgi:hypothetical protein